MTTLLTNGKHGERVRLFGCDRHTPRVLGVSGTTPRSSAWYIELQCPGAAVEGRA